MTDDLIEAVARAMCRHEFDDEKHPEYFMEYARAAIRAAAPLILDMAADEVAGSRNEVAAVCNINILKERFQ